MSLTYVSWQLTLRYRVLVKLTGLQSSQEIVRILWNVKYLAEFFGEFRILYSVIFLPENLAIYEIIFKKYDRAIAGGVTRRMRFA